MYKSLVEIRAVLLFMTQGLLLPAIFISFLSPMTCKRRRERGRRKREDGEVSVFLHLEALAELYINTFVKWAGVVEYWCVSECYRRLSHHEAEKPHAAVLHDTFCFSLSLALSFSSRSCLLVIPFSPSVSLVILFL